MNQQTTLKTFAVLGLLFIGVKMQGREFTEYGLIGGKLQIQAQIMMACKVISPGTASSASLLLAETIAVESRNGEAKDHSKSYGEGLTQFDKPTFVDVQEYFSRNKYADLRNKIKLFLGVDIVAAKYTDLRKSPMLSIVFARLLYYRVPHPIPATKVGRWQYYKIWFNSVKGATTESKYMNASKYSVFKDDQPNLVA